MKNKPISLSGLFWKKADRLLRCLAPIACANFLACANTASATPVVLFDSGMNIDATIFSAVTLPTSVNAGAFDFGSGLGTLNVTITGPGSHYAALFLDHEIDEGVNTFFNEVGSTSGAAVTGESWEIDEPGFVSGDIYDNFVAGTLDNLNRISSPDDVSLALGWNFILNPGEQAKISFVVSENFPSSGFFLRHSDPDSRADLYFSSSLEIGSQPIPDSGTTAVLLGGSVVLFTRIRRRR